MTKLLLAFLSVIFVTPAAIAQTVFKKNTFYGELAGNGGFLSVNYDRQMGEKPGLGGHIGIGLGDDKPVIPLGITYMHDLGNKKSFAEAGAGITLAEANLWRSFPDYRNSSPYTPGFIPSIGYRHHTRYGLMWRFNYTPIFTKYRNIPLFFGTSVGWRI